MNEKDKEIFDNILIKNPSDLTDWERDFLKARRTYLNDEQKRVFESVLKDPEPEVYVSRKTREAEEAKDE